ncbi:GNAT family N-acetyltransferase [Nocardioides plantarum]|uniref:GNAT family N-acetyltransferase n=1 Tax=Nocardioides plantarum TaxID=29299 RepID=A0ABV5KCL9_9ACTN|nr:GNAT family N-acetyltransferase [Nocardioides plantarum]
MTPDAVAAASAAWTWYPADATTVETDDYLLVRWPDYFVARPGLIRLDPASAVEDTLDEVGGQVRAWGFDELVVWVKLDAPAGLEAALQARGAALDETVDVFALDLAGGPPVLGVPDDVEMRWQADEATTRDAIRVGIEAFDEGSMPDDDTVSRLAAEAADDLASGRAACALAYLDGRPVGSGGLTLVDGVARLWGGGVVPDARGRGVYRAVLAARLDHAVEHGAALALVKGRVETSGPILRRAGFAVFGQERSYVVPVPPTG